MPKFEEHSSSELERAREEYNRYYSKNKKHIKYKNVKENLAMLKDRIAMLEYQARQK